MLAELELAAELELELELELPLWPVLLPCPVVLWPLPL